MLSTVSGYSTNVQVGHVDTWTAWVDPATEVLVKACDFVGTNGFPYFQNTQNNNIDQAYNLFWESISAVRQVVDRVKPGVWVWATETGWPTRGPTENQAVPNVANAGRYWKEVACSAFSSMHTFWYSIQDFDASPSFGVADGNGQPYYDLKC
jgi:glucan endo-1,3-beta-D-glucosidase